MVRRSVTLSESTEVLVRALAEEGESFPAAVARLIEAGARSLRSGKRPSYVGAAQGPEDLGENAEKYLRELSSE